jgi:hypothetical protein
MFQSYWIAAQRLGIHSFFLFLLLFFYFVLFRPCLSYFEPYLISVFNFASGLRFYEFTARGAGVGSGWEGETPPGCPTTAWYAARICRAESSQENFLACS